MDRSSNKNKKAKKALKEQQRYEIRSFRGSAVNVLHGSYFTSMSKTGPDMKYFNDHFDVPPTIVLNKLIYRQPDNSLINMMKDATKYAISKFHTLCKNGSELIDTDSDASSVRSALYGEENFGKDDIFHMKPVKHFVVCYLNACLSIVIFMLDVKTVRLTIAGVHVHHPYGNGLSQRYQH